MKIALLIGANPRKIKSGPKCAIPAGNWRIAPVGVVNTELALELTSDGDVKRQVNDMLIIGPTNIIVHITTPGTEPSISVYAEKVL